MSCKIKSGIVQRGYLGLGWHMKSQMASPFSRRAWIRTAATAGGVSLIGLSGAGHGWAEETERKLSKWEPEIAAYEKADRENPPAQGGILFIGSSGIRLWKTLAADFPGYPVLNRGFGGSEIADSTAFAERIIFPYAPKQIFMRAGGNDIHNGKSPAQVFADYQAFVAKVHARLPETEIVYIGLSGTIARQTEIEAGNTLCAMIAQFAAGNPKLKYIDNTRMTLNAAGEVRADLLVDDKLHFNAAGYQLLAAAVRPFLKK
jgi:lysophospholipase L1-like esterase